MSSSSTESAPGDAAPALDTGEIALVTMPQMGVSVAEGTVVAWHKRVGDHVRAEETICDISTDKIDTEVPAPAAGRVTRIVVGVEQTVPVGAVLAIIATDVPAGDAADNGPAADAPAAPVGAVGAGAPAAVAGAAVAGAPAAVAGAPAAVAGAPAAVAGAPAAVAGAPAAVAGAPAAVAGAPAAVAGAPAAVADARAPGAAETRAPAAGGRAHQYTPVVMRIAQREGVDLGQVVGTGRDGRVSKQDVLAFVAERERAGAQAPDTPLHIESPYREETALAAPATPMAPAAPAPPAAPAATAPDRARPAPGRPLVEPMSRMRRSIAEHMTRSLREAAHCTTVMEADMSAVTVTRTKLGLSPLPFIARCAVDALLEHPELNTTIEGDTLTRHGDVHLGIAVSLGERGLIVPVVRDAQNLSVTGLAERIASLARRARSGELSPDDVRGGTFTITNPGGFGTFTSTPIINQPQVAILDVEAVVKRPVVITDALGRDAIAIRPMVNLCLSFDHRALDGALAAQFLATLRRRIESWDAGA